MRPRISMLLVTLALLVVASAPPSHERGRPGSLPPAMVLTRPAPPTAVDEGDPLPVFARSHGEVTPRRPIRAIRKPPASGTRQKRIRAGEAPKEPRALTSRQPAAAMPGYPPKAAAAPLRTRPERSPSPPPTAPGSADPPGSALDPPGRPLAPAEPEPQVPRASVLTPPVLLADVPQYPNEGVRVILERETTVSRLRVEVAEGRVVLRLLVSANGLVGRVEIAQPSGHDVLDRAAVEAAWSWRFSPATRDGTPIDAWVLVPVRFVVL